MEFLKDEYKKRDWWRRQLLHGRTAEECRRLTGGVSRLEVILQQTPGGMVYPDPNAPPNPLLGGLEPDLEPFYRAGSVELGLRIVPDRQTDHPGLYISAEDLLMSTFVNDEFYIYTCSCGRPECMGVFSGVNVVHEDGLVVWAMRGLRPRRLVVFEQQQYRGEILEKIRAGLAAHRKMEADAWFNWRDDTRLIEQLWLRASGMCS